MGLEAGRRYDGVIMDAGLTQGETGTPALWFRIKTDDGIITHEEYVTPNTRVRLAENMSKCFGLGPAEMAKLCAADGLADEIRGTDVSIVTKEEELKNGDLIVKVKWMNPAGGPPKKPPTAATKSKVAALFGASPPAASAAPATDAAGGAPPPAWNDDVPF